jgi:hypothetical protein
MRKLIILSAIALSLAAASALAAKGERPVPEAKPVVTEMATPAPAQPVADKPSQAVVDRVAAEWPRYDIGGKGHLTRDELSKWLGDLRKTANEPAPDANWLAAAFVQTDINADQKVSVDELTAFLSSR